MFAFLSTEKAINLYADLVSIQCFISEIKYFDDFKNERVLKLSQICWSFAICALK